MNVITRIRKSRITKGLALCLAMNMISEVVWPTAAMALTSGPSQPEVQSFEPVETTDMVNMFTGDYTYNIPLIYLPGPNGGYPINLSYHGGVGMDQEASWVGLGWNINAGALVRNVRGFADDYNGDELITKVDMKENVTIGLNYGNDLEIFGGTAIGYNVSVRYNNYKGFAVGFGMGIPLGGDGNFQMGLSLDSETGLGASANLSMAGHADASNRYGMGLSYNSEGLGISFSKSKSVADPLNEERATTKQIHEYAHKKNMSGTDLKITTGQSGLGFSANTHSTMISVPTRTNSMSVYIKFGLGVAGAFANQTFGGFFNVQGFSNDVEGKNQSHEVFGFENYENADRKDILDFTREKDGTVTPMTSNLAAPNLTYDIYSVLGQGIGGNFRPFRTDVGRVHDPLIRGFVSGKSASFDVGTAHIGFGGTVTAGYSVQRPWDYRNDWANGYASGDAQFGFKEAHLEDDDYDYINRERVYYRMHGDKSSYDVNELDFIGGTEPVLTEVQPEVGDELDLLLVPDGIESDRYFSTNTGVPANDLDIRIARNILIHKLKNEDISGLHGNADPVTITSQADLDDVGDLAEASIFYYTWGEGEKWLVDGTDAPANPTKFLDRDERDGKSIAGQNGMYKILNENGQNYVYGLPAYNTKEVEAIFSVDETKVQIPLDENDNPVPEGERAAYLVDIETENSDVKYKYPGTDKYLNKTTKPPYAHSYLLTSVLGADYVDVDNNGPSDADLGYWVKFDYVKYADNYKWRAPFKGANYSAGALSTYSDDKGSYMYGEKEIWYVSRIETKTHVVVFDLAERNDNYEVASEFNTIDAANGGRGTQSGLLIEKISLYLKDDYINNVDAVALQEVHFQYDYSMCTMVKNNDEVSTGLPECVTENQFGKLTLQSVWMTYEGSGKGLMRPYEFTYYNDGVVNQEFVYDEFKYDRWGNYKSHSSAFEHKFLPYVNQTQSQDICDENASAWSLKNIHLPSGGDITMTYESDDYGYVQSEEATQMFPITKVGNDVDEDNSLYDYNEENEDGGDDMLDPRTRRVYFKLEHPLPPTLSAEQYASRIYRDYVEGIIIDGKGDRNLYFKNYTELREGDADTYDYVSGYAPIEDFNGSWTITHESNNHFKYGINTSATNLDGYYTEGFITIQRLKQFEELNMFSNTMVTQDQNQYHPFAIAGWEHMRLNDPLMLTTPAGIDLDNSIDSDEGSKAQLVSSLLGFIPQTVQMFSGVWRYCYRNDHARTIDIDGKSVIRLGSPDLKKRGGGQRVKQITMSDNWDDFTAGSEQITGVVYDYTIEEEDSDETIRTISSGVAQYEPLMGGDEIALRYPKFYPEHVPFNSDNRSYFEYPINEQYYPAPIVGYRKVTVRSLNTKTQMDIADAGPDPDGIGTTGITEYEFYTAKDFPVIVKDSKIIKSKLNITIPVPFIGSFERQKIKAAQGYVIELNDMHGQIKSVKKFGLTAGYEKNPYCTSSVTYTYNADMDYQSEDSRRAKKICRLINEVETISQDNNSGTPTTEKRLIGVEYDFFTDQRQNKSNTTVAGGYGNVDIVPAGIPIPIPSFWPTLTTVKRDLKTFTTNKIIFRSGIVSEVETYDGRARVVMKNEVYDEQTGRPIITSINNEFEDKIYNYSHPAHWEYDRMGGAYKNIDLIFEGKITDLWSGGLANQYLMQTSDDVINQLVSGDQLMVKYPISDPTNWFLATYLKKANGANEGVVFVDKSTVPSSHVNYVESNNITCKFQVIRSGRRNHVFADAGTIVSKEMPVNTLNSTITRSSETISGTETVAGTTRPPYSFTATGMGHILNASTVLFKDEWESYTSGNNNNPFQTGEAGVWRPYKSYLYVSDRDATLDPLLTEVKTNIRTNGEMNDFTFFNWQIQNFERHVPEWQWVSEITKYSSEAYELENTDRLNIKSAALYAYFGSLVVAVGANAGYHELGAEDFERYPIGSIVDINTQDVDDNLGFYDNVPVSYDFLSKIDRTYSIVNGFTQGSGVVRIELETADFYDNGTFVNIAIRTSNFSSGGKSDSYILTGEVIDKGTSGSGNTWLELQTNYKFGSTYHSLLGTNSDFAGRATISVEKAGAPYSSNVDEVEFVTGKAHTGKRSMKFKENGVFPQGKLDLIAGKTYVLSAWVSRDDIRKITYEGIDLEIYQSFGGAGYTTITDLATIRKSKVIEGWQKIEMEFTPTVNNATIGIHLSSVVDANPAFAYIDDVRISPKTGGIITYVYDSYNYRLKAVLDNNNFATFYYYDEEGNLYQVKRETAKGIQTVSENRGQTKVQ